MTRRVSPGRAHCHPSQPDAGRGLCTSCYGHARRDGTLIDHPRRSRTHDDVMADYRMLAGQGHTHQQIANRLGVTIRAVQLHTQKARYRLLRSHPVRPHHLHTTAAAWSLHDALNRLNARAKEEQRAIVAELLEPPSLLRSPTWGRRHALGGHGDPTTSAVLGDDRPVRANRFAVLAADIGARLAVPTQHLPGDGGPLERLLSAIPDMQPAAAAATTTLLVRLDERVRRELRIGADRQILTGVSCPACLHRLVYLQTAGPQDAWTVVCADQCPCLGADCRCGVDGAVEGVAHIWPRAAILTGAP